MFFEKLLARYAYVKIRTHRFAWGIICTFLLYEMVQYKSS